MGENYHTASRQTSTIGKDRAVNYRLDPTRSFVRPNTETPSPYGIPG